MNYTKINSKFSRSSLGILSGISLRTAIIDSGHLKTTKAYSIIPLVLYFAYTYLVKNVVQ